MKVLVQGIDLSEAASRVGKALGTRTINPILEGIKLKAENNTLTLTATDLELGIEKTINADVALEGEAVIPGKLFLDLVARLKNTAIEMGIEGSKLVVKYMENKMEFALLSVDEFPALAKLENADWFTIHPNEFKDLITKTVFSAATEDSRPILKGCHLDLTDKTLTAVALDGYRMSLAKRQVEKASAGISVVVPARSLNEVAAQLEGDEPVVVSVQKNYLMVDLIHTRLVTRLLEGDFINYKQIIPTEAQTTITVSKAQFDEALSRAYLLARGDRNNLVRLSASGNLLTITSNTDFGSIKEIVPVGIEGVDITIAFNAKYFADALRVADDEHLKIAFEGASKPAIIRPDKDKGESFLFLILPVRVL
ncbi:MAG: DNA polymerase III subunit beta [Firmicutes bacterium]|nr:DNA polymerase III subunit beta [Bacillota bacterium]